jgi:hypothetical protein
MGLSAFSQEWLDLLQGKIKPKLSSLSLQLKLNALKNSIKSEKITLADAAADLYNYCMANPKMYEANLNKIFKQI